MDPVRLASPIVVAPRRAGPLLLSIPHAGRSVDPALARGVNGGAGALLALADPHVDALVQPLFDEGYGGVVAQAPRAAIDVNRAADACDPMVHAEAPPPPPGSKAARGLGVVIGRRSDGKALWKKPLASRDFGQWLADGYRPYHDAIASLVADTRRREGIAVLLDCHSMPPLGPAGARAVLGDRHGDSAAPWVTAAAADALRRLGVPHAENRPYAGGEIAARHGRPAAGVHVIQLEIDRTLYLDPTLRRPGPGFGRGQALVAAVARALEEAALAFGARAAE